MIIRAATEGDADALAAIYGHHVLHGFGTFEEEPPAPAEMESRRAAIAGRGLPYLVAEDGALDFTRALDALLDDDLAVVLEREAYRVRERVVRLDLRHADRRAEVRGLDEEREREPLATREHLARFSLPREATHGLVRDEGQLVLREQARNRAA